MSCPKKQYAKCSPNSYFRVGRDVSESTKYNINRIANRPGFPWDVVDENGNITKARNLEEVRRITLTISDNTEGAFYFKINKLDRPASSTYFTWP